MFPFLTSLTSLTITQTAKVEILAPPSIVRAVVCSSSTLRQILFTVN